MSLPEEWKVGRIFTVTEQITLPSNLTILNPGHNYPVQNISGDLIRVLNTNYREFFIRAGDLPHLDDYLEWIDDRPKISPPLRKLIAKHPDSPFVRGFIRAEMGTAPTKSKTPTTTEGWMKFVEETEVVPITKTTSIPTTTTGTTEGLLNAVRATAAARTARAAELGAEGPVPIRVRGIETMHGRTSFSQLDTLSGTIHVPRRIIADAAATGNNEEIFDFIYEHEDDLSREEGERCYSDDDDGGLEGDGIEIESHNINSVLETFRQRFPAEVAETEQDDEAEQDDDDE